MPRDRVLALRGGRRCAPCLFEPPQFEEDFAANVVVGCALWIEQDRLIDRRQSLVPL